VNGQGHKKSFSLLMDRPTEPIQSISCNVRGMLPWCIYLLNISLFPLQKYKRVQQIVLSVLCIDNKCVFFFNVISSLLCKESSFSSSSFGPEP
jgi:hypothetical protein